MLRALLLYFSRASWARRVVTRWSVAWRVAGRFIAGETLDEAVALVKQLNADGYYVTLDHLGENTTNEAEAIRAAADAVEILERIRTDGLRSGLSIKLTQIGLAIDSGLCERNLEQVLAGAHAHGIFVRIDMEDSPHVEATLALLGRMLVRFGVETVGVALQSYLYRAREDAVALGAGAVRIRLVKGAYQEPETVAFPDKADVDAEFDRITDILIEATCRAGMPVGRRDGRCPPILAIASHDDLRVDYAREAAEAAGVPRQAVEFQMLNGIRRDLQKELLEAGYPVRIYVPFGREWYPYMVRRLAERPANLLFFLSNLVRR
ncbi:MAG TPA: proline dehydrogenase family protein [Anaerolineales bacterium]|nr:proline dehydrogenase family protein [Anaerolineales bacterium]